MQAKNIVKNTPMPIARVCGCSTRGQAHDRTGGQAADQSGARRQPDGGRCAEESIPRSEAALVTTMVAGRSVICQQAAQGTETTGPIHKMLMVDPASAIDQPFDQHGARS
jgi:hypothetical protein